MEIGVNGDRGQVAQAPADRVPKRESGIVMTLSHLQEVFIALKMVAVQLTQKNVLVYHLVMLVK